MCKLLHLLHASHCMETQRLGSRSHTTLIWEQKLSVSPKMCLLTALGISKFTYSLWQKLSNIKWGVKLQQGLCTISSSNEIKILLAFIFGFGTACHWLVVYRTYLHINAYTAIACIYHRATSKSEHMILGQYCVLQTRLVDKLMLPACQICQYCAQCSSMIAL